MNFILYLQQFRTPELDRIIIGVSALGDTFAYLIVLSLIYWLIDRRRGWAMTLVFLLFMQGNAIVKDMTVQLRPYQADERVELVGPPPKTHAFPSSHAQAAAMVFGGLALLHPAAWSIVLWVVLIFLVGLTRIYMGVHDIGDVLAGWAFGGLGVVMMALMIRLQNGTDDFLKGWDLRGFWVLLGIGLWLWRPSEGSAMAGIGLCAAALLEGLERRWIGFADARGFFQRLARIIIGLAPYLLLIPFFKYLGPEPALWVRLQFVLLGALWIFMGGPLIFKFCSPEYTPEGTTIWRS